MKIIWLTDIHLNFIKDDKIHRYCQSILTYQPDMVLVAGDIAEAPTVTYYLSFIAEQLQCPIYFVLGNHDYYKGAIASTRDEVAQLVAQSSWLNYLPLSGVVELSQSTALVGHDSWSDGRYGNYETSKVMLNDYVLIKELSHLGAAARLKQLNVLGDEAADYFRQALSEAFKTYRHVMVLTHVPPFVEAAWHEGHYSDDEFAPHFSCKAVGDALLDIMTQHPDCNLTVLCGHTHSPGVCQKRPNLQVITGEAVYRHPQIQAPIYID
jgi:predicted MPP superfamily phosphohydrolase